MVGQEGKTMRNDAENGIDREYLAQFIDDHYDLYGRVVMELADCIEQGYLRELSVHVTVLSKCIEVGLNLIRWIENRVQVGGA